SHRVPAGGDLKIHLEAAVSRGADQGIETRRNVWVCIEILPERHAEDLMVRGSARSDKARERSPGIGHPTADAIQIEPQKSCRIQQTASGVVERKPAGLRLQKNSRT